MRPNTHEYETELRVGGRLIVLEGIPYQGRTVLQDGPDRFAPLERWAKGVAEMLGEPVTWRSEEHTSELQSRGHLVCRLLLEKTIRNIEQKHNHQTHCT